MPAVTRLRCAPASGRAARADGAGRVRQQEDALGKLSTAGYDAAGARLTMRDAVGVGEDCTVDGLGRDVYCIDTAGRERANLFDAHNNAVRRTDARNKTTDMVFDARDRKTSETDRIAATTAFAYDAVGNLVRITDAQSGVTDYAYDQRNLLITEIFPTGQKGRTTRSYTYDGGRRLTQRAVKQTPTSTTSEITGYAYDAANRLTLRSYSDAKNDSFAYDDANRLLTAGSARYANTVERSYDAGGRLLTERLTGTTAALKGTWTVATAYDADNRTVRITAPDGRRTDRTYTARNQLETISDDGVLVASRSYDDAGRLTSSTLGNGLMESRGYEANSHLVSAISIPGVTSFGYSYDENRRKTVESHGLNPAHSQNFGYDDADRLTSWSEGGPATTQTWTLSPVGDWTSTVRNGVVENRTHTKVHEVTTVGAVALTYDLKGNLTTDESARTFTWDRENRLATAKTPAAVSPSGALLNASYLYDALGRRVAKIVDGRATRFLHTGAQVIQEEDLYSSIPSAYSTSDGNAEQASALPTSGGILAGTVTARIDFQATNVATADGFYADKGRAYGARTNGLTYGWSATLAGADMVTRASAELQELDTYSRLLRPGTTAKTWNIAVPNGTYPVVVIAGDATSRNHTNNLVIEGAAVIDPDPKTTAVGYEKGDFDGYAVNVTVTDGQLTIVSGTGAYDPTLCAIEIGAAGTTLDPSVNTRLADYIAHANSMTFAPRAPVIAKRNFTYGEYIEDVVTFANAGQRYWAHSNHLFSVAALTDAAGNVTERYRYDAYGKQAISSASGVVRTRSAVTFNRGYTGLYEDKETGLLQSLHRMYDTKLGRWISRDPWRSSNWYPSEGDGYADGYSLYAAYFIPNALDPYGLKWMLNCERCTKKDGTGGGWMYHCKLENDAAKEGEKKPDHADANDYDKYKKGGAKEGGKGNQPSDTAGDPNGSNGPLPAGNYDLIPGNSPTFGDVPGITDKGGKVPGSITTPEGTKRTVLWIHPQANLSQGCITVKNNKAFIDRIQAAIKEDGGRISLVVKDVGECKPCEECEKK